MKRKIKNLGYSLLLKFLTYLGTISHAKAIKIGNRLGYILYLFGFRRKVVDTNLVFFTQYTGKKMSRKDKLRIYQTHMENLCEIFNLNSMTARDLHNLIDFESEVDRKTFEKAVSTGGLLMTGHLGNWEIAIYYMASLCEDIYALTDSVSYQPLEEFIRKTRLRFGGNLMTERNKFLKNAVKHLEEKKLVCILADQNISKAVYYIDFFGKSASLPPGPGFLAHKCNAPIYTFISYRLNDGKHRLRIREMEYSPSESRDDVIMEIGEKYNDRIMQYVTEFPTQYLWINKRYKTRPKYDSDSVYN